MGRQVLMVLMWVVVVVVANGEARCYDCRV